MAGQIELTMAKHSQKERNKKFAYQLGESAEVVASFYLSKTGTNNHKAEKS
jgi:hypothetical protein